MREHFEGIHKSFQKNKQVLCELESVFSHYVRNL